MRRRVRETTLVAETSRDLPPFPRRLAVGPDRAAHLLFSRHAFHGLFRLPAVLAPEHQGPADHHPDGGCRTELRSRDDVRTAVGLFSRTVRHARALQRRIVWLSALRSLGRRVFAYHRDCVGRLHGWHRRGVDDVDTVGLDHVHCHAVRDGNEEPIFARLGCCAPQVYDPSYADTSVRFTARP